MLFFDILLQRYGSGEPKRSCECAQRGSFVVAPRNVLPMRDSTISFIGFNPLFKNGPDHPFDFLLVDKVGPVKIQVKMQRLEKKVPKHWGRNSQFYVVETQKTRSGKDRKGGSTRPYQFGEFDLLAVSLHPSGGDWTKFRYTVADWLFPRSKTGKNRKLVQVFQPVPIAANADWCDDFETAVGAFRNGKKKTIHEPPKR